MRLTTKLFREGVFEVLEKLEDDKYWTNTGCTIYQTDKGWDLYSPTETLMAKGDTVPGLVAWLREKRT